MELPSEELVLQESVVIAAEIEEEPASTPDGLLAIRLLATLFISHAFLALVLDAYHTHPWIDIPVHVFGGLAAGYTFIWFAHRYLPGLKRENQPFVFTLMLFAGVLLGGVGVEFLEFAFDHLVAMPNHLSLSQLGNTDTIKDLLDDILGGVLALIIFRKRTLPD